MSGPIDLKPGTSKTDSFGAMREGLSKKSVDCCSPQAVGRQSNPELRQ